MVICRCILVGKQQKGNNCLWLTKGKYDHEMTEQLLPSSLLSFREALTLHVEGRVEMHLVTQN